MKAKAKGTRVERLARKLLEEAGFYVIRAGGSLGVFDLVAIPKYFGKVKCIQVKANKKPDKEEMRRIHQVAMTLPSYCVAEVWIKKDYSGWDIIEIKVQEDDEDSIHWERHTEYEFSNQIER
jgi:Holliday junction resolvase